MRQNTTSKPKFLVLVDDSPEADVALVYALRRALKLQSTVVCLGVVNPDEFLGTHLFGVGEVMRQEVYARVQERLNRAEARLKRLKLSSIEIILREGKAADCLKELIEEDKAILSLVLAAGIGLEGSGPLVTSLSKAAGHFPIPIIIVPGRLSEDEIEALTE